MVFKLAFFLQKSCTSPCKMGWHPTFCEPVGPLSVFANQVLPVHSPTHSLAYCLQWQTWVIVAEVLWPPQPKIFTSHPLYRKSLLSHAVEHLKKYRKVTLRKQLSISHLQGLWFYFTVLKTKYFESFWWFPKDESLKWTCWGPWVWMAFRLLVLGAQFLLCLHSTSDTCALPTVNKHSRALC